MGPGEAESVVSVFFLWIGKYRCLPDTGIRRGMVSCEEWAARRQNERDYDRRNDEYGKR